MPVVPKNPKDQTRHPAGYPSTPAPDQIPGSATILRPNFSRQQPSPSELLMAAAMLHAENRLFPPSPDVPSK